MNPDVQSAPTQRYTRLRELGRGGNAIVELVYDEVRHTALACKRWERASAETRFRLKQQYRRALTVRHPNVVRLYELFAEGDVTCLTMEAVLGVDVRGFVLNSSAATRPAVLLDVLRQLTDALITLHAAGIVHRDVKPSNVLVEADGRVVLLDGGFAWPRENPFEPLDQHALTCTVPYLAPECLQGALPSVEADWYGFAALAAELIVEQPPFAGSLQEIMRAKDEPPDTLSSLPVDRQHTLEALVCALLQRDPRSRPSARIVQATVRELTRMLPTITHVDRVAPVSDVVPKEETGQAEAETQSAERAEVEARPRPATQEEAAAEAELGPPPATHAVAEAQRAPDVEADLQLSTHAEMDPELASHVESEQQLSTHTQAEQQLPTHTEAESQLPTRAEAEQQLLTHTEAEPQLASQAETEPHSAPQAEAISVPDAVREQASSVAPIASDASEVAALVQSSDAPSTEDSPAAPTPSTTSFAFNQLGASAAADSGRAQNRSTLAHVVQATPEATPMQESEPVLDSVAVTQVVPKAHALNVESNLPPAPASTPPNNFAHAVELRQLEALLDARDATPFAYITGATDSGKTALLHEFIRSAHRHGGFAVFDARCRPDTEPFRSLEPAVRLLVRRIMQSDPSRLAVLTQSLGYASLTRMFPTLESVQPCACAVALEPQRAFIEGLLAFRELFAELSSEQPVLLVLDDIHNCDPDAARLLEALVREPSANLTIVVTQNSDEALAPVISAALDSSKQQRAAPCLRVALGALAQRAGNDNASAARRLHDVNQRAFVDPAAHMRAAESATKRLALARAADLYRDLLEATPEASGALLRAAAQAQTDAGRLREAATCWLALAHATQDREAARRYELAAGAARMRAGDEQDGSALICNVLRAAGVNWPRVPVVTAALDRMRALWRTPRPSQIDGATAQAALARFDALWTGAKEVALLEPATGDALSARALRESLRYGDASRQLWTLGYEAVWEANLGGSYLRKRAAALQARVYMLAEQTGDPFDNAYARSVQGVVAWFGGEWAQAEIALRDALQRYAYAPEASTHERHVLESFLASALEAQGKLPELRALLANLRLTAAQTGHVHAAAMCGLAELSLPALVQDQPLAAIAHADAILSRFASDELTPLHFQHFVVTVSARLHAGHAAQAFAQVEQLWQRLTRSYFLRLDAVGVMLRQLRARAALALAKQSAHGDAQRLCKLAAKEATVIGRSGLQHAQGLEHLIDCGVASLLRQHGGAQGHCAAAVDVFDRAGMPLMREIARHAGSLLSRDSGQAERDQELSAAYFRRLEVRNPRALVAAWFPTLDV